MPVYRVRCPNCGEYEIEKPMSAPLPRCEDCGAVLRRVYIAPAIHYHAAGFYATDVKHFEGQVGPERAERVRRQNDAATARARAGTPTAYERALEAI